MPYRWLQVALDRLRGVEPYEVLQALSADRRLPVPGTSAGIPVLAVMARTRDGRLLTIVLRDDGGREWLIVGARNATRAEAQVFEAWEGQR